TIIGAMLAPMVAWDRVVALLAIYFLALGIGAHAFDALGSRVTKPWGEHFTIRQLWILGGVSLTCAYLIGIHYMVTVAPYLWPIAIAEGFFVLAYNLEWFHGRFHTDGWFALSWGALPVLAGHVLQTNSITLAAVLMAMAAALFSLVEIKASRPYKEAKRSGDAASSPLLACLEGILKCISGSVLLLGAALVAFRWNG
ncbi:MAG TPA: hypothetical protein VEY69_13570, partial [Lautropia sp.]|nr:hypothetical protein [Lautropia sp.]